MNNAPVYRIESSSSDLEVVFLAGENQWIDCLTIEEFYFQPSAHSVYRITEKA